MNSDYESENIEKVGWAERPNQNDMLHIGREEEMNRNDLAEYLAIT